MTPLVEGAAIGIIGYLAGYVVGATVERLTGQ